MGQTMTERFNVTGAMLVKIFGRTDAETADFSERAGRVRDIGVTTAVYSRILMTSMSLLAALATALVYGVGGVMAIGGSLGVGTVVALTAYLGRLYGPITSLSNLQVDVMTTLVSFERVLEVLDLEPMVADAPHAKPLPAGAARVEFDHVAFRYPAASDVSLASLESVAKLSDAASEQVTDRHHVHRRARPDGRAGGPVRCRQDHGHEPGVAAVRRDRRRRAHRRRRCP